MDFASNKVPVCRGDLPEECKILYDKVAGNGIVLDYPGFPLS